MDFGSHFPLKNLICLSLELCDTNSSVLTFVTVSVANPAVTQSLSCFQLVLSEMPYKVGAVDPNLSSTVVAVAATDEESLKPARINGMNAPHRRRKGKRTTETEEKDVQPL